MDHMKNIRIKEEETNEVQIFPSKVKIKEELQEDSDEEVQIYPSNVKIKEELQGDSDEEFVEDPFGVEWSSVHIKEEPKQKLSFDDSKHKIEFSADDVDGDESSSPLHQPGSAEIAKIDGCSPKLNNTSCEKSKNTQPVQVKRQLFIGNLTWWTTDQEITDAILGIGVADFIDVKFFEHRTNGQSKGFCVVTLGSEASMKICMERLPKQEFHGQNPLVTFPTKSALNQFENQSKKEFKSRPSPGPKKPPQKETHSGPGRRRTRIPIGMLQPSPGQQMPGPLIGHGGPQTPWHPPVPPPHAGFHYNNWNGPRANGPRGQAPLYGGPPQGPPAPHVNAVFFPQGAGPPHQPPPSPHHPPPHFYGPPPVPQTQISGPSPQLHPEGPSSVSEVEFQEVMGRNKSILSSAIARAVCDAAAGEYTSAIETLVTAISLIKQSKVASDARCKILINSLQDALNGIEAKSYESARRERSQSRDRERSLRSHQERSRSRDRAYRERSRDGERERVRDTSFTDAYPRDRSGSRDREREPHYREHSRENRHYDRYRERERERNYERTSHEAERERKRRDERDSSHHGTHH